MKGNNMLKEKFENSFKGKRRDAKHDSFACYTYSTRNCD